MLAPFIGWFGKFDCNCNCYFIIEKSAFTPNHLSRDRLMKLQCEKVSNLNNETSHPELRTNESWPVDDLYSKRIV